MLTALSNQIMIDIALLGITFIYCEMKGYTLIQGILIIALKIKEFISTLRR